MTTLTPAAGAASLQDSLSLLARRFAESSADLGDGDRVSYRSCGEGPAIVLLHGISSGAASWLPCALHLASGARVIAWDAPGYGDSSPLPQAQPRASDYAARLEKFLTALGVTECVLAGHSLGALMAAAYARNYRRAARILLISPAQGYGSAANRARGETIAQERLDILRDIGIDGMAERSPGRMLSARAGDDRRAWVRWNIRRLNPDGYTQAVHMLCGDDLRAYACNGETALRAVCCGADDIVTTPDDSRLLALDLNVPFSLIGDAGHACYIEQPEAVATAIRAHLYQLS